MHMLVQYNEWMNENDSEAKQKLLYYYKLLKGECTRLSRQTNIDFKMKMEIFMFSKSFSLYKMAWKLAHKLKRN